LEDLEKFTRETIPVLEKFKPKNDVEKRAMEDAMEKANEVKQQAIDALKSVPKTEKKRKQP